MRWEYRAKLVRIVDADTVVLDIDQGLETTRRITVRLALVDAVERSDPKSQDAIRSVQNFFIDHTIDGWINITTIKDRREKYGRYLALVHSSILEGDDLAEVLVKKGFAVYKDY
jgi:micrococcal nuclease